MKLKLTVRNGSRESLDIQLTADVTVTVGQAAHALVVGHPQGSAWRDQAISNQLPLTLRVHHPGAEGGVLLDTAEPLGLADVRSGAWIEAVPLGRNEPEDRYVRPPRALLRCMTGPLQGTEFPLFDGPNLVGRHWHCRVRLADPLVSRTHARIDIAESDIGALVISITDLGSLNGTMVGGAAVVAADFPLGTDVMIGNTRCRLVPVMASNSATAEAGAPPCPAHVRSPRVAKRFSRQRIALPAPPARTERPRPPLIAMMAPLLMGIGMYAVTRSVMSLMFIALSPLISIATWVDSKLSMRRKQREGLAAFDTELQRVTAQIEQQQSEERQVRQAESPASTAVAVTMVVRDGLLWTRRPEHQEFGEVRWGQAMLESRLEWDTPSRTDGEPGSWARVEALSDTYRKVGPVPVVENLQRAGNLGIVGTGTAADEVLCALVIQLAGLHSPQDLVLSCFANDTQLAAWEWLKWLPHVASVNSPLQGSHLAADDFGSAQLLAQLEAVLLARRTGAPNGMAHRTVRSRATRSQDAGDGLGSSSNGLPTTPVIVVVVLSDRHADTSRLLALAEDGPDGGIHVLWLAPDLTALPAPCRTFALVEGAPQVGYVRSGEVVMLSALERVPLAQAASVARNLAAVVDAGARDLDESDLPATVAYVDLVGDDVAGNPDAIIERWQRDSGLLDAVVGRGSDGVLNLSLRDHGPHALVGGTTGAGKSEFLQTWMMSLAATHSPERVTFLLIDYKGGAAFAECVDLPHTVGLVTDLTAPLVRRALTSLRAELQYRERLLAQCGAKDLVSLESRGDPRCPPALVIVVDEFAALVGEVPEFIDGVVDVAQRGRSLGLHVVLATQRPAGVIRESLRANTNLRVALRVADAADSFDVVGVKDAAEFDPQTPGRAIAKVGPGAPKHFQAGFLGGRGSRDWESAKLEVRALPFGLAEAWASPLPSAPTIDAVRDIDRLTNTIVEAAARSGSARPRRPWLDALPTSIDLEGLFESDVGRQAPHTAVLLGVQDEPENQRRMPFIFNPEESGNMAIFGASGAGKSGALRALALAVSHRRIADPVQVYVIDAAGGALSALEVLPTVGAVVRGDDDERIHRLLRSLLDQCERRHRAFADARADSLSAYRHHLGLASEPRQYLLLDGIGQFCEIYDRQLNGNVLRMLTRLITLGRQVGVHVVMTADRCGAIPTTMAAGIQARVVLRMASEADYAVLGVAADQLQDAAPGRGICQNLEVQWAVWGGSGDLAEQVLAVETLARTLMEASIASAPGVPRLPTRISWADLPRELPVGDRALLGLNDEDLEPIGIPLGDLVVVSGPPGSGRTTAIRTALAAVFLTPGDHRAVLLSARNTSEILDAVPWCSGALGAAEGIALAEQLAAEWGGEPSSAEALGLDGASLGLGGTSSDLRGAFAGSGLGEPVLGATAMSVPTMSASTVGELATRRSWATSARRERIDANVLVVEASVEYEGTLAEAAVADAIRVARRAGCTVIVESEPVTGAGAWRIHGELKSARAGILLQPDDGDALSLFRVMLPRATRADFPVGRGYLVERGVATKLQVALPPESGEKTTDAVAFAG